MVFVYLPYIFIFYNPSPFPLPLGREGEDRERGALAPLKPLILRMSGVYATLRLSFFSPFKSDE